MYCPARGDLIWLDFNPQSGHEQAGRRPALVISDAQYNGLVGLALVCPITSKAKGYPFEVSLDDGLAISGVVLSDRIKSLDWRAHHASFAGAASERTVKETIAKIAPLLLGS